MKKVLEFIFLIVLLSFKDIDATQQLELTEVALETLIQNMKQNRNRWDSAWFNSNKEIIMANINRMDETTQGYAADMGLTKSTSCTDFITTIISRSPPELSGSVVAYLDNNKDGEWDSTASKELLQKSTGFMNEIMDQVPTLERGRVTIPAILIQAIFTVKIYDASAKTIIAETAGPLDKLTIEAEESEKRPILQAFYTTVEQVKEATKADKSQLSTIIFDQDIGFGAAVSRVKVQASTGRYKKLELADTIDQDSSDPESLTKLYRILVGLPTE